ncbi:MAG: hypothetical protein VSS75_006140 [Candidatus Parabeggiatoa sp.]|nr:hypothetical protein [Candidatus Parabeggiatoa sp.]
MPRVSIDLILVETRCLASIKIGDAKHRVSTNRVSIDLIIVETLRDRVYKNRRREASRLYNSYHSHLGITMSAIIY